VGMEGEGNSHGRTWVGDAVCGIHVEGTVEQYS
jgi:hypothetical protein